MPCLTYRNLYENDYAAMYQYLSAIPPTTPGYVPRETTPDSNPPFVSYFLCVLSLRVSLSA